MSKPIAQSVRLYLGGLTPRSPSDERICLRQTTAGVPDYVYLVVPPQPIPTEHVGHVLERTLRRGVFFDPVEASGRILDALGCTSWRDDESPAAQMREDAIAAVQGFHHYSSVAISMAVAEALALRPEDLDEWLPDVSAVYGVSLGYLRQTIADHGVATG